MKESFSLFIRYSSFPTVSPWGIKCQNFTALSVATASNSYPTRIKLRTAAPIPGLPYFSSPCNSPDRNQKFKTFP